MYSNKTFSILSDDLSIEVFFKLLFCIGKKKLYLVNSFHFRNSRTRNFIKKKIFFNYFISNLEIIELPFLKIENHDDDIYRKTNKLLLDYLDSREFIEYVKKINATQILEDYQEGIDIAFKKLYIEKLFSITLFNEILFAYEKKLSINKIFLRDLKLLSFEGITAFIFKSKNKIISNIFTSTYDSALLFFFILFTPRFIRDILLRGIRFKAINLKKYKTSTQIVWGTEISEKDDEIKNFSDFELFNESKLNIDENLFLIGQKFGRNEIQQKILASNLDSLELTFIDESRLSIPFKLFFKKYFLFGLIKRSFNLLKLKFTNINISLFELHIIDKINLSIIEEKVLSNYAEVEISVSKNDYTFEHIIKTTHQNSIGKINVGIQHSALSKPIHHPGQAHTFFDIYFTMGSFFEYLWTHYWGKNKKNIIVGSHRGHLVEKAKKDKSLKTKFKQCYPNLNIVMLISPIDEYISPEWLIKESYNNFWKICDLNSKINIILRPRRIKAVSDFRKMFPIIKEYEKRKKIFFEVNNFSTQELIAFTDFFVAEEGSGSISESAFQDHIDISTIVIRTPILDELRSFSFTNMNDLKKHIKNVLEGKFSNLDFLKIRNKISVNSNISSSSRIGNTLIELFSKNYQL